MQGTFQIGKVDVKVSGEWKPESNEDGPEGIEGWCVVCDGKDITDRLTDAWTAKLQIWLIDFFVTGQWWD